MQIQDRIKELRRVRASDLVPNPRNWRSHPPAQRDALCGVLAEIGYADALLARELEDGRLELIDGHLRAETTPDAKVPVLVLDVNEEEALKILLTHDPLAALAETNMGQVDDLLGLCDFDSPHVAEMLDQLQTGAHANGGEDSLAEAELQIPELFQVVVQCDNEEEQREIYERMREEGRRCRVLTL